MPALTTILAALLAATVAIIAVYVRLIIFTHWQRRGFPFLRPHMPWGNLASVMLRRTSFGLNIHELYQQCRSSVPLVGVYLLWRPALLVRDPQLIRRMLGADFAHFHDRGVYSRPVEDPISDNLFAMTGQRWRRLRAQLTPMFTGGRLKAMLPTLLEKGDNLVAALDAELNAAAGAERNPAIATVDMKDFVSRYGLDAIASVFFGLDVDTIRHRRHKFRIIEKHTNNKRYMFNLVPILIFLCPRFLQFIRLPSVPPTVKVYVMRLVTFQIRQRERENVMRKDFIQFLIQIRNAGRLNANETDWRIVRDSPAQSESIAATVTAENDNCGPADLSDAGKTLSVEQCAAQVFLFYIAGFDTSASVAAYTVFEAARNPQILRRLRTEIDAALARNGGELTYEAIGEMRYLELCVMETARKYPVLPLLNRVCTQDYRLPDGRLIPTGTAVVISLLGLLRDARHFPQPLRYCPERFADAGDDLAAGDRPPAHNPDAYIPFGDGPRTCIGIRLGKLMAKVVIVKLLAAYDLQPVDGAELEFENYGITLHVRGGIPMRLARRRPVDVDVN